MKRFIFVLALVMSCSAGGLPVKGVNSPDNIDRDVKFLFELKGVSVFRFYDNGYYRYFTIGNGSFSPQIQERIIHNYDKDGVDHPTTETWVDGALK